MRFSRAILYALACLVGMSLVWDVAHAQERRVWVVSDEGGVHAEVVAGIESELGRNVVTRVRTDALASAGTPSPDLIVTVGTAAFERSLIWLNARPPGWGSVPVLASLLPRAAYEARLARVGGARPVSAVVLDQPHARKMALIRRALPDRDRIGVVLGPQTRPMLASLQREAGLQQLQLVASSPIESDDAVFSAVHETLTNADVLLALPEPLVFQTGKLQHILLASYRVRVPVVGFSAAQVKAGATITVHSTPAQVARETAMRVHQWFSGQGMGAPSAPREFFVATNPQVAASLGIVLDNADRIAADLRRAEGGR